ncbi:Uncharacterized protein ALO51_01701 [Pseudomonas amygdali]|uniref:hypothetical protein n=1 Tax=Pseudomonas amygdali TaxID=47877 RepID=UPI0006E52DD9|nr:hypothetical protein [Pseudomonas amygdali]KPW36483.1 Uncharacterized protein ALO51_01701 [Pseudomonas amygdali]
MPDTNAYYLENLIDLRAVSGGANYAFTHAGGGFWRRDPLDTISPENLDAGVLVAADGSRWKLDKTSGPTRAEVGKPGTSFNDNGWIVGWYTPGENINGNGNKFNYASLYIPNDRVVQQNGLNGATGSKVDGLNVTMGFGGPSTRGGRHAIDGVLLQGFGTEGATDQNNADRNYVGVQGQVLTNSGDGGTSPSDLRGAYFGGSDYVGLYGTAKYVNNITGREVNTDIQASDGTRVDYHTGIQIASNIGERGFTLDTAISVSNLGGSPRGWGNGISFSGKNGGAAFEADSTAIRVFPSGAAGGALGTLLDTRGVTVGQLIAADGVSLRRGILDLATSGALVNLGSSTAAGVVQFQGRSSGLSSAWDARLAFIGGTSTTGQGVAQIDAGLVATSAAVVRSTAANYTALGTTAYPFSQVVIQTSPIVTSDVRQKTEIEKLTLGLDFVRSFAAAEQGLIQYRMAQTGGKVQKVQTGTRKVERQATETVETVVHYLEMVEGKAIQKTRTEQTEVPIFDVLQVWDESGNPVMVEEEFVAGSHEELNENQEVRTVLDYATRQMQLTTKVPRMEVVEEPVYEQAVYQREGGRVHLGISAQELRAQLLAHGIDDCAAWCLADPEDPESTQSVREAQLIPVLLKAVAELASEVETLRSFAAVGSNAN